MVTTLRAQLMCSWLHHLSRHLPQAHLLLMSLNPENAMIDLFDVHIIRYLQCLTEVFQKLICNELIHGGIQKVDVQKKYWQQK